MKKILSLFVFVFIAIYTHAQCEDHILETLKQTKIYYFQYVSEGSNANIYISYPFAGTTYKAIDDATGTEYTAVNSPLVNAMVIPVGAVNSARTFTLKMENGTCSVTHSEKPYIRPHVAPYLAIRTQSEWCASSGAIFFEMIGTGVNAADYNYYIKKENETHYNPTPLNQSEGVTNLISGKYIIKAVLKNPPHIQYEQAAEILSVDRKIEFDLKTFGGVCDNRPSIKVNVKKGAYPLWYSVYDKTGTTLIRPDQLSPVFEGLDPKTEYKVFVKDFCSVGGGNAENKNIITIDNQFKIWGVPTEGGWGGGLLLQTFNYNRNPCPTSMNIDYRFKGENLHLQLPDRIPLPMRIQYTLTSPSGKTYSDDLQINTMDEFNYHIHIDQTQ